MYLIGSEDDKRLGEIIIKPIYYIALVIQTLVILCCSLAHVWWLAIFSLVMIVFETWAVFSTKDGKKNGA